MDDLCLHSGSLHAAYPKLLYLKAVMNKAGSAIIHCEQGRPSISQIHDASSRPKVSATLRSSLSYLAPAAKQRTAIKYPLQGLHPLCQPNTVHAL